MDDEKLVLRLQNGDEAAFEALYGKYYKRLYDLAYRMSNSEADTKDALQETFLEVHRSIRNLREPKYFSLWIRKILLSKIKQIFAKNKVAYIPDHDYRMENQEEAYPDFLPEHMMHFHSDQVTLQDFVKRLPYHYREVLLLTYFEGWKNQEIADMLDIPLGTVKSRLNMAKQMLKKDIKAYEQKNHIKLNFHEDVLAGALMSGSAYVYGKQWDHVTKLLHGGAMTYVKITVGIALAGMGIYGAAGMIHSMSNEKKADSSNVMTNQTGTEREAVNFKAVMLDGKQYRTPYQAYMGLKDYMHCEYEMKEAKQADFDHIMPLYTALKNEHGVYFELLEKQGWVNKFEEFSNH